MTESAREVALDILVWARQHGALANELAIPALPSEARSAGAFPELAEGAAGAEEVDRAARTLERIRVVTAVADEDRGRVVVLTKNQVSSASQKALPDVIGDVRIDYVGNAGVETNPPNIPLSTADAAPRTYVHNESSPVGALSRSHPFTVPVPLAR